MSIRLDYPTYLLLLSSHALWWTVPFVGCAILHLKN